MCFRKKKEQIKEPQSVPANPKTPIVRKMSLWGGKSFKEPVIDIPKELEYLKNNYYQNSFLKSSNEQKKPEPKIENPTSEKLEINTFQAKSDSILTDNKLSEIAEAGSVENNETPRLCMKKSEQLDKNAHFREEVVDSIRPLRANENVTKGEALALVTTVRSEYFQDTNKVTIIAFRLKSNIFCLDRDKVWRKSTRWF